MPRLNRSEFHFRALNLNFRISHTSTEYCVDHSTLSGRRRPSNCAVGMGGEFIRREILLLLPLILSENTDTAFFLPSKNRETVEEIFNPVKSIDPLNFPCWDSGVVSDCADDGADTTLCRGTEYRTLIGRSPAWLLVCGPAARSDVLNLGLLKYETNQRSSSELKCR
jgi:hypothetical protein